jgi:hypothetical protein
MAAIRALRSHSASKSLSASVVAGIEPHHPAAIPPIVSCHSATAASHRALETRLCPSRCRQKGEGTMDAGFVGVAIAITGVTMVGIYLMWRRD